MSEDKNKDRLSDLIHFYEVRVAALSAYSNIVWNRFNWFLTLQLAMVGFYIVQLDKLRSEAIFHVGVPLLGIIATGLWFLMGYEDYRSLKNISTKAKSIEKVLMKHFELNGKSSSPRFRQSWLLFVIAIVFLLLWVGMLVIDQ